MLVFTKLSDPIHLNGFPILGLLRYPVKFWAQKQGIIVKTNFRTRVLRLGFCEYQFVCFEILFYLVHS